MWGYSIDFWDSVVVWATALAAVAGAISVASGFVAGIVGYQVSQVVQDQTTAQIAEAHARGEAANQAAAEANARAAEANLALEKYKAPRTLDAAVIDARLRPFGGQRYQITTFWESTEPLAFSNLLHKALTRAGWVFVPHGEGGSFLLGEMSGLHVYRHSNASENLIDAADALVAVLRELDLNPQLKRQAADTPNDGIIRINVGTKF